MNKQLHSSVASSDSLEVDLSALVVAAQKDPRKHFDDLYLATWQMAYGIALPLVRSLQDAEDITQQTYVNVYRYLKRLKNPESFRPWLSRIVVNLANSHLNKRTKLRSRLLLEEAGEDVGNTSIEEALRLAGDEDVFSSPEESIERGETQAIVREAIERLPHRLREVIVLRYYADFSLAQIADILDISKGSVGAYLNRANVKLRELLQESLYEEEDEAKVALLQALLPVSLKAKLIMEADPAIAQRVWVKVSEYYSLGSVNSTALSNISAGLRKGLRSLRLESVKAVTAAVLSVAVVAGGAVGMNAAYKALVPGGGGRGPATQLAHSRDDGDEADAESNEQPVELADGLELSDGELMSGISDGVAMTAAAFEDYVLPRSSRRSYSRFGLSESAVAVPSSSTTDSSGDTSGGGSGSDQNGDDSGDHSSGDSNVTPLRPAPVVRSIIEFGTWKGAPLTWRVLQVSDGIALCLSEYVLSATPYQAQNNSFDYAGSDVRVWINEFAASSFSTAETSELKVFANGDYASVLSFNEINSFLSGAPNRAAAAHPLATGLSMSGSNAPYWTNGGSIGANGSNGNADARAAGIGPRPVIQLICE